MRLHWFENVNSGYIRKTLRLGGSFWESIGSMPLEQGNTFTFLPAECPPSDASDLTAAILGGFEDLTAFREEESFILRHIHREIGNMAIFGCNATHALRARRGAGVLTKQIVGCLDGYYDKLLVLHGGSVRSNEISEALLLTASPFLLGALLETQSEDPLRWLEDKLQNPPPRSLVSRITGLAVEAYRGEGTLFWTIGQSGNPQL